MQKGVPSKTKHFNIYYQINLPSQIVVSSDSFWSMEHMKVLAEHLLEATYKLN